MHSARELLDAQAIFNALPRNANHRLAAPGRWAFTKAPCFVKSKTGNRLAGKGHPIGQSVLNRWPPLNLHLYFQAVLFNNKIRNGFTIADSARLSLAP
jgi:hypothetical protein